MHSVRFSCLGVIALTLVCLLPEGAHCQDDGKIVPITIRLDGKVSDKHTRRRDLTAVVEYKDNRTTEPVLSLEAWGGEATLTVDLNSDHLSERTMDRVTSVRNGHDQVRLTATERVHELYVRDDGAFEWNIVLNTRPADRVLTYDLATRGLVFVWQPPLGKDSIDYEVDSSGETVLTGILHRPDSVAGSYAVYHRNKSGNHHRQVDGETLVEAYATGKAFQSAFEDFHGIPNRVHFF